MGVRSTRGCAAVLALAVVGCSRVVVVSEAERVAAPAFAEFEPSTVLPQPRLSGLVVGGWGGCVTVERSQLWCWGAELRHRSADLPPFEAAPVSDGGLRLGRWERCAVEDGKLACKRDRHADLSSIVDVEHDLGRTCVAHENGEVRCWDDKLSRREGVVDVEVFAGGVCVRTDAGRVACPGGELPAISYPEDTTLKLLPGIDGIIELEFGVHHGCMVNRAGRVRCVGRNDSGQLGVGDTLRHAQVVDVILPGAATELAASEQQTCAIVTDEVWCWGANEVSLGNPHFGAHEFEFEATALHVEEGWSCANRPDGSLWCWGAWGLSRSDFEGGAAADVAPRLVPSEWPISEFHDEGIRSGDEFIFVSSLASLDSGEELLRIRGVAGFATDGLYFHCVFGGAAGLRCVVTAEGIVPDTSVPKLRNVSDLTINWHSMCAVHGGRVSCLGDTETRWVRVPGLAHIHSVVDDGDDRTCALAEDGRIYCWYGGPDEDGIYRVDDGPYVLAERDVVEIAWGWELLARTKSGALRSGSGNEGEQLRTLIDAGVLEVVGSRGVGNNPGHACARVDQDGDGFSERIACFGDDRMGQLGRLGEHVRLRPKAIQFPS
jgi:hypothetical protein